jgi:prepilin peptidase CpaA
MAPWPLLFALLVSALAALSDHLRRVIPNWLTLPPLVVALVVHGWSGGLSGLVAALLATLGCLAPAYFLFVRGGLGGGDVKLFAALGAVLGFRAGLEVELAAFVMVAAFALFWRAYHGGLWALVRGSLRATLHMVAPQRYARPELGESAELPMGGAIFFAVAALALRSAS